MTENQKKLIAKLEEMFQFDQADLDFGIYRIMAYKRDEIKKFLTEDLSLLISKQLEMLLATGNASELEKIQKEIENAKNMDVSEAVKTAMLYELEEKKKSIKDVADISDVEGDIYSHLTNFFSRYYDEGDFISQRRYKDGVYAIPYEGEEVKLHWANADQYYIKTSEYFKDYSFKTKYGNIIHFKIVEAEAEKDNNKQQKNRFFQLYTDKPFEIENDELIIYFEYKEGNKKKQDDYNKAVVEEFGKVITRFPNFASILAEFEGKSLLERQLNRYTARNTFDYFIHKDLGKFLNRELDSYIKNDVIFLDDIDEQDDSKTKRYLVKAKVIRNIGKKIIAFLAQIEDFQKKLWLKKKFVVETNYCITLDQIPEKMYPQIINNREQIEEWKKLFAIANIKADLIKVPYSEPLTIEFLKQNPYLVLDTAFFPVDFIEQLIESIDNLDEKLDGLLIHSENFQALNLLQERYKEQVKCVYIDPPYNTAASEILYKNNYKHSSWLSMITNRLLLGRNLLRNDGVVEIAIDDAEFYRLQGTMNQAFGDENHVANIAIMHNPKGREQAFVSDAHEYTLLYAKDKNNLYLNRLRLSAEEINEKYPKEDKEGRYRELPLRRRGTAPYREDRPYMYFPFVYDPNDGSISVIDRDNYAKIYNGKSFDDDFVQKLNEDYKNRGLDLIFPIREDETLGRWRWGYDRCVEECNKGIFFVRGKDSPTIYHKDYVNDTMLPKSIWFSERFDASTKGTNILKDIIPHNEFDYPKSIFAVEDFIQIGSSTNNFVLDFFAGSGTTAHAVINLNREDEGNRKYILVEMGEYFDSVTRTRINKVVYSKDWKKGKPVSREGSSHSFKYLRLEGYEDSLNNIEISDNGFGLLNDAVKEQYLINYMLPKETIGSVSLLNIEMLSHPFDYKMNITQRLESKMKNIDLVETFNYLIGLKVERSYARKGYDAEFITGEYGLVTAKLKDGDTYKIKMVEGRSLNGDSILIIWRDLTGEKEKDNAVLDAFFEKKKISTTDFEYKKIYVNGDNNLPNLRSENESWKVILIEEEMKKRMFHSDTL